MYTLALTPQALNVLAAALGRLPYEQVAPLIREIEEQIQAQTQRSPAPSGSVEPTN